MPGRRDRQRVPPAVSAEVIERWGNDCWLGMPGCTNHSDTTDHIVPHIAGGPTVPANLRRACKHCNSLRGDRTLNGYGALIHAVIGPPAGGKSTYVDMHRQPGAVVLDFDALAKAMMPGSDAEHVTVEWVRRMASGAWYGAYRHMVRVTEPVELWLVKTLPFTPRSPRLLDEWIALDYDITVCDPGKQEVMDRLRARGMVNGCRPACSSGTGRASLRPASMRGSRLAGQGSRPSGSPTDPMPARSARNRRGRHGDRRFF